MKRSEREEMKALSLEVFGTSSKWEKLVTKGYQELVTETKTEVVPGVDGAPDTEKEVKVPVLRADGAQQFVIKRHTVESIKELMLKAKAQLAELQAAFKKQQEDAQAAKEATDLARKVQEELGGSAL